MRFHVHIVLIFALQFLRHFPLGANSHIHPLMHYSQAISIFALQPLRDFPLETNKHIFSLESFKIAKLRYLTMQNISSIYATFSSCEIAWK